MTEQSGSEPTDRNGMPPGRVVIVGPDGMAIGEDSDQERERPLVDMVEQPAKVMRIGSMIRQLLEEVRSSPLDEKSRVRLRQIHERSVKELESGLAPELSEELERLSLPFTEDEAPSEAELRVAQAQLVGWLEGLFHGIQTTLFAQQMAARAQLEQMRRALPPGTVIPEPARRVANRKGRPARTCNEPATRPADYTRPYLSRPSQAAAWPNSASEVPGRTCARPPSWRG